MDSWDGQLKAAGVTCCKAWLMGPDRGVRSSGRSNGKKPGDPELCRLGGPWKASPIYAPVLSRRGWGEQGFCLPLPPHHHQKKVPSPTPWSSPSPRLPQRRPHRGCEWLNTLSGQRNMEGWPGGGAAEEPAVPAQRQKVPCDDAQKLG